MTALREEKKKKSEAERLRESAERLLVLMGYSDEEIEREFQIASQRYSYPMVNKLNQQTSNWWKK